MDYPIIIHIHSLIDINISGISLIDENDYWPRIKKLKINIIHYVRGYLNFRYAILKLALFKKIVLFVTCILLCLVLATYGQKALFHSSSLGFS